MYHIEVIKSEPSSSINYEKIFFWNLECELGINIYKFEHISFATRIKFIFHKWTVKEKIQADTFICMWCILLILCIFYLTFAFMGIHGQCCVYIHVHVNWITSLLISSLRSEVLKLFCFNYFCFKLIMNSIWIFLIEINI